MCLGPKITMEQEKQIHLHISKRNHKLLLLFVPSVAFILTLFIYLQSVKGEGKPLVTIQSPIATPKPAVKVGDKEIKVELADTPEKTRIGLSKTKFLSDDEGMLFVFEKKDSPRVFWMKGMSMPIDIIWIDDSKVIQIDENVPFEPSEKLRPSNQPVDYVLEVAAGFSERYTIAPGTMLILPPGL